MEIKEDLVGCFNDCEKGVSAVGRSRLIRLGRGIEYGNRGKEVREGARGRKITVVEGPGVAPVVEGRSQVETVEAGADIRDDPEYEPHCCPLGCKN